MPAKNRNMARAAPGRFARGGLWGRYFLTRDSVVLPEGLTLSDKVDAWLTRPIRHRVATEGGYVWIPTDLRTYRTTNHGSPLWASLTLARCETLFGAVPTSDNVSLLLHTVAA